MLQPKLNLYKPLPAPIYDAGSRLPVPREERLGELSFKIYKCNNRPKLSRRNTVIIPIFGEFGSNTIAALYCIPKLMQGYYAGRYSIVVTWPGTKYLYQHLCDEVWEVSDKDIGKKKEFCRAFHHHSKDLSRCEELLKHYGNVIPSNEIGYVAVNEIFKDVVKHKPDAVWLPSPSSEKIDRVKKYIKPNTILVNARNRKCYNRNYTPEFYVKLCEMLKATGHHIVWVGDETTLSCSDKDIVDFSSTSEAKEDIEFTFALTSMAKCTIQCHTASHRIAAISGIPHIIYETADQLLGNGQEGIRSYLADRCDKRKIIIAHFWDSYYNNDQAIDNIKQAICEIENNNFNTMIGQVSESSYIKFLIDGEKRFPIK